MYMTEWLLLNPDEFSPPAHFDVGLEGWMVGRGGNPLWNEVGESNEFMILGRLLVLDILLYTRSSCRRPSSRLNFSKSRR